MPDQVSLKVNGASISVPSSTTVAVALALAGQPCRTSVTGQPRGPLCGMGICFECRVTINGIPHCRSCQIPCEPEMDVMSES
jgi:aerobic-type carbon monoxide dehydrogenase small subunit (CoxS/CutS family)